MELKLFMLLNKIFEILVSKFQVILCFQAYSYESRYDLFFNYSIAFAHQTKLNTYHLEKYLNFSVLFTLQPIIPWNYLLKICKHKLNNSECLNAPKTELLKLTFVNRYRLGDTRLYKIYLHSNKIINYIYTLILSN